ncbi:DUF2178 domain-containing protein [Bacillus cereus]|uniref:DUF2178 domain-containing protein n=1 Tax=Bacillus cereus TaxID=1396 RepID=A0A2A8PV19_BACCE|nr:hypothetical protein [Bacillus cereus]EJS64707.1 hypothetical protein ICU_04131 [Bacillus cereus BAG2X1-1]EJS73029.1 hypothetical protein ICY_03988 [Bacillus cereus BAG2X1-3]PEA07548.1 DUF2178 domain-containing protein [Bacillus cereus]PEW00853.1 DUF2178 domain-containing protein [Bacillus cereus]PFI26024.1 DUF2178 domain-containing protein [Bacillus cereus]
MNRIGFSYIINVLYTALACWTFVEFYNVITELADIIKNEKFPFEVWFNGVPFILLFIGAIIVTIFYRIQKRKYKNLSFWMYPLLFPLEDEREKAITDKACRTTFVSLWFVLPCAVGFLTFSPIINEYLPGYPLYILFSIFFIQMTVFHISLYRNKLA